MRLPVVLAFLMVLAGCSEAPQRHGGLCEPVVPLLVGSGVVNGPRSSPHSPTLDWTVVWPDGRVERWGVKQTLEEGPTEESSVLTRGGLDPELACGVAVFHGGYPGPDWPISQFPGGPYQIQLEFTQRQATQAGAAPLEAILRDSFFDLPADASVPDCADGITRTFSAHLDGRSHRSQAYCEGTPEFEAFVASVAAWLGDD